jgi:hypothetical protein
VREREIVECVDMLNACTFVDIAQWDLLFPNEKKVSF